jgi:hypothetical protein
MGSRCRERECNRAPDATATAPFITRTLARLEIGLPVTKKARLERAFSVIRDIPLEIRRDVVLGAYHSRFECRDERIRADLH